MEVVASTRRPPSHATVPDAAGMLRLFIEAVESGELAATTPQDVAVVRRLQGALTALETMGGDPGRESRSAG